MAETKSGVVEVKISAKFNADVADFPDIVECVNEALETLRGQGEAECQIEVKGEPKWEL